jgi:phosphatidylglycerophosphate synthase
VTVHHPHPALSAAEVSRIPVAIRFRDGPAAERLVAGIPAAARAAREVAAAGFDDCRVYADVEWRPSQRLREEIDRLAKPARVALDHRDGRNHANYEALAISGEELIDPEWAILKATGKPGDGIVSRSFNRPISRFISRLLLKLPLIRPGHATSGTALIALAMVGALLWFPSKFGLIAGAVLFQWASIFDGVDGEIARATFRTSSRGAMLDSLVDAATNFGFIAGVVQSLYRQGDHLGGMFGLAGLGMLTCGLCVIGLRAKHGSEPFTFNEVKDRMHATGSLILRWLTWLTMRDFYALAAAVLIAAGLVHVAVEIFAVVAAGWLVVVLATSLPGFRAKWLGPASQGLRNQAPGS